MTTRPRYDEHSTEFGLWLREQEPLSSKKYGYVTTNIDYLWENYKSLEYMYVEEKRFNSWPTFAQRQAYQRLHERELKLANPNYRGVHFLVFDETNPEDSLTIWWDGIWIGIEQLLKIFQFKAEDKWYQTDQRMFDQETLSSMRCIARENNEKRP